MNSLEVKNANGNKAVIFVRVSSREQKEGYSIDAQLARLRTYCERKNLEIIKEFTIVESSTRGEREKFYEMINFIKNKRNQYHLFVIKLIDSKEALKKCL